MRFMRIVLLLPLVFPTVLASATVSREIADTVPQLTGGTRPVGRLMIASAGATAFLAGGSAAGQDAQAVEAGLGLDRPTRRLIQRGLANEGFDPGVPDGLFGPRTRAAIRRWQYARRRPPTGYLDSEQARLLRLAGAQRPAESETSAVAPRPAAVPPASPAPPVNCDEWNTREFFETATPEHVSACLAAGADVAARTDDGHTPLHQAASYNRNPAVVRVLLAAGADRDTGTHGDGHTPVHEAATNDNPAFLEALLAAGADAMARDDSRRTPMHFLAQTNTNPAALMVLLAAGADIEARDEDGFTPLHRAAWRNTDTAVLEALIAAGGDIAALNEAGIAPGQNAAWANRNPAVLTTLFTAGTDPIIETRNGRTLLHLAVQNNDNPAVLEALLAAGVDLASRDDDGNTPLHAAARSNANPAVIKTLLSKGADGTVWNDNGATPISLAIQFNDNSAIAEVLLAAEATLAALDGIRRGGNRANEATGNAQLPPEILVDRHLVRAERLVADDNYGAALAAMNEVAVLQREHGVALADQFHFDYAQIAYTAGLNERSIVSIKKYLLAAGREGESYREALDLLDSAEQKLRQVEAERRQIETERLRAERLQRASDALAQRQTAEAQTLLPVDRLSSGGLGPQMVRIAGGRFQYTFPFQTGSRRLRWVEFDKPFAISKYEVTREQFARFLDRSGYRTDARRNPGYGCNAPRTPRSRKDSSLRWNRPGFDQTDDHPVTCVSTRDAMAYAQWLSRETGNAYRVPSAPEWQYAARAGSNAAMLAVEWKGHPNVCMHGNLHDSSTGARYSLECSDGARRTTEVGRFLPNAVGLHDMIGNVAELVLACATTSDSRVYQSGALSAEGPDSCERYVVALGSSWYTQGITYGAWNYLPSKPSYRRSRYRRNSTTWAGFRVVRDLTNQEAAR